jgi:dihydropteroate synthase
MTPAGADTSRIWSFRGHSLDLSAPRLMGVVNATPDSFSDGGKHFLPAAAARRAEALVRDGADVLDVGGESTRPGADPVPEAEEVRRVLAVVREAVRLGVPVSVDTTKPAVARAALDAGAQIVNDVSALTDPEMGPLVAAAGAGVILMHRRGTPKTMQANPRYDDVVKEVREYLSRRRSAALGYGIPGNAIVLDPGIGFGKDLNHNLDLILGLKQIAELGSPILLGLSRKSFLGALSGVENPEDRDPGTVAAILAARLGGGLFFRVHNVAAARQALAVFEGFRTRAARRAAPPRAR